MFYSLAVLNRAVHIGYISVGASVVMQRHLHGLGRKVSF